VTAKLQAADKQQVVEELLDMLCDQDLIADRAAALEAIWQREQSMSTGLQFGVAIPHGKTDAVDHLVAAVGIHPTGIDYGSMDGLPSRIFVLTLSPETKPAPHVRFMSAVSQLLDKEGRDRILACGNRAELYRALRGEKFTPSGSAEKPSAQFQLADYLDPGAICTDLTGQTPEQAIDQLLDVLERASKLADPAAARAAVLRREQDMPTGLENHVALPHGRTDSVDQLICAVGLHRAGLDFGAVDNKPAHVIVLVLAPNHGEDPYLQFLGAMIGAVRPLDIDRVLACRRPQDLLDLLTGQSTTHKPEA
jgi:PTS system nitrogen regulatory IIA component